MRDVRREWSQWSHCPWACVRDRFHAEVPAKTSLRLRCQRAAGITLPKHLKSYIASIEVIRGLDGKPTRAVKMRAVTEAAIGLPTNFSWRHTIEMFNDVGMARFLELSIWAALLLFGVFASRYAELLDCPQDVFICGSASSDPGTLGGLARAILLLLCAAYPSKILLYLATRNRLLRSAFDDRFRGFDLRRTALRGAFIAMFCIAGIYLLTFGKIWASRGTISTREYVWSNPINRSWRSVVAILPRCDRGARGSWNTQYNLLFRDGGVVDLSKHAGPISVHKAAIFSALRGHHFYFDARNVDVNCIQPFHEMATQRPQ